jgi:hypothetical protein
MQYLYYIGKDGCLYQLRWGTGFWVAQREGGDINNQEDEVPVGTFVKCFIPCSTRFRSAADQDMARLDILLH